MITFREYLIKKGLFESTSTTEINQAHREYLKLYQHAYYQRRKQNKKRVDVFFEKSDYNIIEKIAKQHKKCIRAFIRESCLAYLNEAYVVPDEESIRALELKLKQYGNLLNQISYVANVSMSVSPDTIRIIQEQLKDISVDVSQMLRKPITVEEFVELLLSKKPEYVPRLWNLLCKIIDDYDPENNAKQKPPVS